MAREEDNSKIPIQLAGFKEIDSSAMEIINRNIEKHCIRIAELAEKTAALHLTMKPVHEREKSEIYDIHSKLTDGGTVYASHVTDRNLLIAIDKALEKVIHEMD